MRHERFASKIAYACIFAESIEEASENLVRLITHRDCGFDEGSTAWCDVLVDYLQVPDELCQLNRFGARFTAAQWSLILQQVWTALLPFATAGE
jgi:hypothetical protein